MNSLYNWCGLWAFLFFANGIQAQDFILEKLNDGINTREYNEISPSVSRDGNTLFFTRVGYPIFQKALFEEGHNLASIFTEDQYDDYLQELFSAIAGKHVVDPVASGFNQDIWIAHSVHNEFDQIRHPEYPLNNALPNSICSLTPLANQAIVINQFSNVGGMQKGFSRVRQAKDGSWSFPEAVNINNYHNSGPDVNMTMSSDGKILILAMEREDSYGSSDLYVSFRVGENEWTEPQNLGPYVNTPYRETTPFLSEDMRTIYYASDRGNNSKGGSDIFVQSRTDDSWRKWTTPKRFRYPINSKGNDSHPCFNEATGYLYFTSNRKGSSDIYRIQIENPKPIGVTVQGIVINRSTNRPIDASVISYANKNQSESSFFDSKDGNFRIVVPYNTEYTIEAKKEGFEAKPASLYFDSKDANQNIENIVIYLNSDEVIEEFKEPIASITPLRTQINSVQPKLRKLPSASPINILTKENIQVEDAKPLNVSLYEEESAKLTVGAKVEMEPIYFARSNAYVLSKSYSALDRLAKFLRRHDNIRIKISGHTDNIGEQEALIKLSNERAAAVKGYLIRKKNINPNRIEVIGYGSRYSLNDNSNERLRQENRRVEIEIIEINAGSWGARSEHMNKE